MSNLFTCIANDDMFTMSKLINDGACINSLNSEGETPLQTAIIQGSLKAVKILISSGADPNYRDPQFNETLLQLAIQQGNKDIIILLFDAGADPKAVDSNEEGPVFTAIRWSSTQVIPLLSERGCSLTKVNRFSQTPLSVACEIRSGAAVQALLDCGVSPDTSGVSPSAIRSVLAPFKDKHRKDTRKASESSSEIFDIVSNNQIESLRKKMKSGIKVNETVSFNGESLIHIAALYGAIDCVKELLKAGANINAKTEIDQQTPLHISIREGYFDIFHILLDAGADVNAVDFEGVSPLFVAVKYNKIEMLRAMVRKGGNVNVTDSANLTPLKFAVLASNKPMVEALLHLGAKIDGDDFNPYMFAYRANDTEIAKIIKERAPKLAKETLLPKNFFKIIKEDNVDELRKIIGRGFNINSVDNFEGSPLHCAIRNKATKCMDLLIDSGADVNNLDVQNRETPLMTAISTNESVVNKLLDNPMVNCTTIRNKEGETALFYAIRENNKELVKELLNRGADINEFNNGLKTPLYVAVSLRLYDIIQLLIDNEADQEIEVHTSISMALSMNDKKIINILSSGSNNFVPMIPQRKCESRKLRSSLRVIAFRKGKTVELAKTVKPTAIKEVPNDGLCVICRRNKATQQLVPCGHITACKDCIKQLIENQSPCPICGLKFYATKSVCPE